jgi:hypothetical protein
VWPDFEYSKPSLIRIDEAKDVLKDKKKPRKQINGKFNNIDSADENK